MKKKIYNVALLGMNEKGLSTFAYFIRKQADKYLKLATPATADVFIADFDTEAGISQWHEHCRVTKKPSIILSVENPDKANSVWVRKPVASNELMLAIPRLIDLLENPKATDAPSKAVKPELKAVATPISKELNITSKEKTVVAGYKREFTDDFSPNLTLSKDEIAECCGIRENMPINHPDFDKLATFQEDKTLLQVVKKAIALAKEKNAVVHLEGLPFSFSVLPTGGRIYVDLNNRHLRHLCAMPMQVPPQLKAVQLSGMDYNKAFPMQVKFMPTVEQVLWQIALWTARGRLLKPLRADTKLRLQHWPNFTRLQITPYALQIAALWVKHDMTAEEVAESLNIPQRFVFAVASAAQVVGILEQKGSVASAFKVDWKPKSGLFNSILRSLKIA